MEKLEAFDAETYILSHWKAISKVEFNQEITTLRTIAIYTDSCKGEKQKITEKYKNYVERELTDDELEIIEQFVNGY